MIHFKEEITEGFTKPTALPQSAEQARQWQAANRSWWERHPMRYDWKQKVGYKEFTKEFYMEIDKRFFLDVKTYMPWKEIQFDCLIDYASLQNMDVLEIGVGNGCHASLFAKYARSFTGIDITDYAVRSTQERMRCFGLNATIIPMDAEHMGFEDNTFDFIWSWGVIHHSANTPRILQEMHRVLRPGGQAITMVYHRNLWNYYIIGLLLRGLLQGDLLRTKSLHTIMQHYSDGAIARFYSIPEWKLLVSEYFCVGNIMIFGSKSDIILLPGGKFKKFMSMLMPNNLSRFLTNYCKIGSFLVSTLKKAA